MIGTPQRTTLWAAIVVCVGLALAGCGSDGSAGIGLQTGPPTTGSAVQGIVYAPNGEFASAGRWWSWMNQLQLVPRAYALLQDELMPVQTTQNVSLSKMDATEAAHGSTDRAKLLAQAETDANGQFQILSSSLTVLDDESELLVQVGTVGSTRTRAFVLSHSNNDITPVTETVVRVVLDRLTKAPPVQLSNFTLQGLMNITDAVTIASATATGSTVFDINQSAYQLASQSQRVAMAIDNATGVPVGQ